MIKNKRKYHHGDARAAILAAVDAQIKSGGPEAVSLRAAAKTAGLSPGATFKHFSDKRAVMTALAADGFVKMAERIAQEQAEAKTAMDRFAAVGRGYLMWALVNPSRFRVMFRSDLLNEGDEGFVKATASLRSALSTDIAAILPDGIDAKETARRALLAWGAVHGIATLAIEGQLKSGPDDPQMPPPAELGAALSAMEAVLRAPIG